MSISSCNPCSSIRFCSETTKEQIAVIATAVALVAMAAVAISLLSKYQIIVGINAIAEKTFLIAGVGVAFVMAALAILICARKKESYKIITLNEFEKKIEEILDQENPLKGIEQLATTISLETVQGLLHQKFSRPFDILQEAKKMKAAASLYLAATEDLPVSIRARLNSVFDTFINFLDSLFLAFGISDFFEVAENKFEKDFKFQKIIMLIGLFTLLTATLLPMFGITNSASIVGGTLCLIFIMSFIWPYVRPQPTRLPGEAENLSKLSKEGNLPIIKGRKKEAKRIAKYLLRNKRPVLIGPSGIGKTQTIQAFVQALERGEFPGLEGKTVFYFNMANLVASKEAFGGGNKILKRIYDAIKRHRNGCILVLDEIAVAYREHKNSVIGQQLKTFLDTVPYVIGCTTAGEYYQDIYKSDLAGDRRFEAIPIFSTDEEITLSILNPDLIKKAPDAIVEKGALQYLVEKTKDLPQPITARNVLSLCIEKMGFLQDSLKSQEVEKVRTELENVYYQSSVLGGRALAGEKGRSEKIDDLEKELAKLEIELKEEEKKLKELARHKKNLAHVREAKFRDALKLSDVKEESMSKEEGEKLSEFLILKYFMESALEERILQQADDQKVKACIDTSLIDEVLEEEKNNLVKKLEALERAQNQVDERNSKIQSKPTHKGLED